MGPAVEAPSGPTLPPPRWGRASIADLLPSAVSLLRPVTQQAEQAAAAGITDRLGLRAALTEAGRSPGPYRYVCVVLVDGLGTHQLAARSSYAPTLTRAASLGPLDAPLPTTTAASLTCLGTGTAPGETGMVGYEVMDPARGVVVNQLGGWDPTLDPLEWQNQATVFERLAELGVASSTVSPPAYEHSGLTQAALRGAEFEPARGTLARVSRAVDLLRTSTPRLIYLYWPELDQAGHRYGWESERWEEALEELESSMRRLRSRVGEETLILLSADHGMVDISAEDRVDYSADPRLVEGVRATAGEPRLVQLHLADPADQRARRRLIQAWTEAFGDRAWILERDRLIEQGYFGPRIRDGVRERIGDLIIAAHGDLALWDLRRTSRSAMDMVGQHGSWTRAEREIPLLAL